MLRWAEFSPCKNYRYTLGREWDHTKERVVFVLLNPSTADAFRDDPTNRRGIDFAKRWGFGSCVFVNLFAWRSSHPKAMMAQNSPRGRYNNWHIINEVKQTDLVLCAWGNDGAHLNRAAHVEHILRSSQTPLYHLGRNKDGEGEPKHILYLSSKLKPKLWE